MADPLDPKLEPIDPSSGSLRPSICSGAGMTSGFVQVQESVQDPSQCKKSNSFTQNIFVLRHGERLDHVDSKWELTASRPWDPPLTVEGTRQAWAIGKKLRSQIPDVSKIVCSPFIRCVQTAAEVIKALSASTDELFMPDSTQLTRPLDASKLAFSIEYGLSEVMNTYAIRNPRTSESTPWVLDLPELYSMLPPGSIDTASHSLWPKLPEWPESTNASHVRYWKTVQGIADKYPAENILFVTHGEGVAVTASKLQDGLVYGVNYCALAHAQRSIYQVSSDGKLAADKFEFLTKSDHDGILFGNVNSPVPI